MVIDDDPMAEDREVVRSLERGLAVIRAFDADTPAMPLSEVARRSGLSRASARRFLRTLEAVGYVRAAGRDFALTPKVLEPGYSYLSSLTLPEVATPHLVQLSQDLGESCSVAVLEGTDIVYVARASARRIMSVSITVGTRFPAYATSMGRVLLAALGPAERSAHLGRLQPITPRTIVDRDALEAELGRVAAEGYALVDDELEIGLRSIAVPVVHGGEVVAALNVSTQSGTSSSDVARGTFVPPLLAASTAIADDLAPVLRRL